jgi:chromosomal replication initiation ATPase DnaA
MKNRFQTKRTPTILPKEVDNALFEEAIKVLDISTIETVVCEELKIDKCLLFNKSRKRDILFSRQLMMYFLSVNFNYTYMFIGGHYGYDHATCMWSRKMIETLMSVDKNIYHQVSFIAHKIIFKTA